MISPLLRNKNSLNFAPLFWGMNVLFWGMNVSPQFCLLATVVNGLIQTCCQHGLDISAPKIEHKIYHT